MVLVAVGEDDRVDVLGSLPQIGEVGEHEVDAELIRRREHQPGVDDHDAAVVLDDHHVLPDLPEPAQGQDPQRAQTAASRLWRSSAAPNRRRLLLVRLDQRQPQPADRVAREVERGLHRNRVGGDRERLEEVLQGLVQLRASLGLVDHPAHLAADEVRGHADAPRAPHVEHAREHVVVACEQVEPVDRREVLVTSLLDGRDVVDLSELGEEVVRHVERRAAGDVVENDRPVGGGCGGLEMGAQAAPVRLDVIGRDDQHRVDADLTGPLSQLDRVARGVGVRPGHDQRVVRGLGDAELPEPRLLLVGQGRRLARAAREHEPVGPVLEEVPHEPQAASSSTSPFASNDVTIAVRMPPMLMPRPTAGAAGRGRGWGSCPRRGGRRRRLWGCLRGRFGRGRRGCRGQGCLVLDQAAVLVVATAPASGVCCGEAFWLKPS